MLNLISTARPTSRHPFNFCFISLPYGHRYRKSQERRHFFILRLTFSWELAWTLYSLHLSKTLSQDDHRVRHLGTSSISNKNTKNSVSPSQDLRYKCTYRMNPDSNNMTVYFSNIVFLFKHEHSENNQVKNFISAWTCLWHSTFSSSTLDLNILYQ